MAKYSFTFTKDYLDCIAQAWILSVNDSKKEINTDEVVLWVYMFTKKHSFHDLFWKFFWWESTDLLTQYAAKKYWEWVQVEWTKKLKLQLPALFNKEFSSLQKEWIAQLNFVALLYWALTELTPEFKAMIDLENKDLNRTKEKLLKVIKVAHDIDIGPIDFFNTLETMVKNLKLDINQMDMFIDMWTITWDDLDIDEMMTMSTWWWTMDATSDDVSSDTPTSNEDKKLTIEYFATDLTHEAKQNFLDPVIGREKEINQIIYTLLRKSKNNPMLIWEAWVWKTAIIEWLAQRITSWAVPEKLQGKRIMMLDMWSLVAGTKYRGEFESRLKAIIEEAVDPMNNIILFVDEVHTIIGAGNAEWSADAANMLKPLLARGKLQMIGATTYDEYQKHIEKDPALKRRFQELHVEEPSPEVTIQILDWLRSKYEEFHGVNIDDSAIEKAVNYSSRYIMNKQLPDKAIDLIDEACARLSTLQSKLESNNNYTKTQEEIKLTQKKIEKAIEKQDYFKAAEYKEKEESLKENLKWMRQQNVLPKHLRASITEDNIWLVLAEKLGIPMEKISESEIQKLWRLDTHLNTLVLGQDEAVNTVVQSIKRNKLSAIEHNKPIWSFLFLWASWVWKTYVAKLLAKEYFGDEKALIRVDMSEFMEKYSVSKLIGSAPWYVWYEEGWLLTEQVRRKPYSVILFDEIEKASPDVLNIMLQIFDEWHLKDNKWRRIDFKNTIIILTSNIGSEEFSKKQVSIWFQWWDAKQYDQWEFEKIKERVLSQVKETLPPELVNRLTKMVVFKPLNKEILAWVFKMKSLEFLKKWKEKYPTLKLPRFSKLKISWIINEIYDPAYWARPIERYFSETVETELIEQVMHLDSDKK